MGGSPVGKAVDAPTKFVVVLGARATYSMNLTYGPTNSNTNKIAELLDSQPVPEG